MNTGRNGEITRRFEIVSVESGQSTKKWEDNIKERTKGILYLKLKSISTDELKIFHSFQFENEITNEVSLIW